MSHNKFSKDMFYQNLEVIQIEKIRVGRELVLEILENQFFIYTSIISDGKTYGILEYDFMLFTPLIRC